MFQARRYTGRMSHEGPTIGRSSRSRNGRFGSLGDLVSTDTPLFTKRSFNIDKLLDPIYQGIIDFLEGKSQSPIIDVFELRHSLGLSGNNPRVIFPAIVNDILSRRRGLLEVYKGEKIRTEGETMSPNLTFEDFLELEEQYYYFYGDSGFTLTTKGARYLKKYIEQIGAEGEFYWKNGGWRKDYFKKKN